MGTLTTRSDLIGIHVHIVKRKEGSRIDVHDEDFGEGWEYVVFDNAPSKQA